MSMPEDTLAPISESFWDIDFYRHTVKRTEDGLNMCNEMMKFLQERADIEKEYAKRLKAWVKKWNESFDKGPEYGTNKQTLKGSLDEANNMADIHLEIKDRILNEVQTEIKDWKNENYRKQMVGGCKEAKGFEDDFKRAQKPWAKRLEKMMKCKKDYYLACRQEKSVINQENNARNSTDISPDQMKRLQERSEKCRRDVEATRVVYKQSLEELNAYNARYVNDMVEVFKKTQEFEEKRLKFFKTFLYDVHSCLDISQNKKIPEIYKQLHQTIDISDSAKDLKWWAQYRGIDMLMAWPAYEEYITEFHTINRKERSKSSYYGGSDGVVLTALQKSEPKPSRPVSMPVASTQQPGITTTTTTTTTASSGSFNGDEFDKETDDSKSNGNGFGTKVRALYSYEGLEGDELSFKAGEIFLKVKDRDDQGWCTGQKDGHSGLYPDSYAQEITDH